MNSKPTTVPTLPWEYNERLLEKEAADKDTPTEAKPAGKLAIGGITVLKNFGGLAQESVKASLDAGMDLLNQLTGLGQEKVDAVRQAEQLAQNAQENSSSTDNTTIINPDHETVALKMEAIRDFLEGLKNNQSSVVQEQKMNESVRVVGRAVTAEDAREIGASASREDIFKTATLHGIAQHDTKIAEQATDQQQEISSTEVTQQTSFKVGENELINNEVQDWKSTPG